MTDFWGKAEVELKKPLSADAIKPAPAGKFGDYVDGLHVISEANRIFGHGGWSYEITRIEEVSGITVQTRDGADQYRCGWMCTVKVNVNGVTREGAAVGMGSGKPDSMSDVIESAVKEAETDALKRALRSFGNTFGLALYEKDKSKRQVAQEPTLRDKIDAASGVEDVNALIGDASSIGGLAKKHLHAKAVQLGLTFNTELGKYAENAGG